MTSFILRLIAIVAMLLDHTAAVLVAPNSDAYTLMRIVGRIAFPIFCFLIVEGFEHTRSVAKYTGRLAIFALLSEIPFDLAFHDSLLEVYYGQNVFFTLLLGLLAITAAGRGVPWLLKRIFQNTERAEDRWVQMLIASPAIALCCWLASLMKTDYGWFGVLCICLFYLLREQRVLAMLAFALLNTFRYCLSILPDSSTYALFCLRIYGLDTVQWFAPMAAWPILSYNGKSGSRRFKSWFYIFYPAHLLVLWAISLL